MVNTIHIHSEFDACDWIYPSHRENESRVSQLESVLSERASTISMLQEHLTTVDKTLKQQEAKTRDLENLLIDKEKIYQKLVEEGRKQTEEWIKVILVTF